MIDVIRIELDRLMGGSDADASAVAQPPHVWERANQVLTYWQRTVPPGASHIITYTIYFQDGHRFGGKYILVAGHFMGLDEQIRHQIAMITGDVAGDLATKVRERALRQNPRASEDARTFVGLYQIGDASASP